MESIKRNKNLIVSILIIFGVVFSIALFVGFMLTNVDYYDDVNAFVNATDHVHYNESLETVSAENACWFCNRINQYPGKFTFLLMLTVEYYWYFIIPAVIALVGGIAFLLIPTDKKSEEPIEANASAVAEAPAVEAAPTAAPSPAADPAADPVAELKRYKELLDNNIITQEEFEAKKKQLLGI